MLLNEERQVIKEKEDEVSISNAMTLLNEGEQSTSIAVILLNSEESTSNAEQLICGSSLYRKLDVFMHQNWNVAKL